MIEKNKLYINLVSDSIIITIMNFIFLQKYVFL